MPRLTITLSEERYQALKEAAVKRRKNLVALIDESLESYGIKSETQAKALVAEARRRAGLPEDQALELAVVESRAQRTES
jgi:hypothetical protein